jgi:flagellar hook-associated protein 1 FlgK
MSFLMLNIASRALAAQQLAMDVTGQNMANATTPGYQRQEVVLTDPAPVELPGVGGHPNYVGQGVSVQEIQRVSNAFLSRSVRAQTGQAGTWSAISTALAQLEPLFSEPSSSGLAEAMNAFFAAWQTLSENPASLPARTALLGQAQQLVSTFQNLSQQLQNEQSNLDQTVVSQVGQVNDLAQQIAALNGAIGAATGTGSQPNDLLNQRGELLTQLSKLANITYMQNPNGSVDVYLGNQLLVQNQTTLTLEAKLNPATGVHDVVFQDGAVPELSSGTLYGTMTVRGMSVGGSLSGDIPTYASQLNTLASGLAAAVNPLQASGYGLSAATPTGIPFFTSAALGAGAIAVNPALVNNPDLIAAASTPAAPGDGSNALAISDIAQETLALGGSSSTLGNYWTSLVSRVGLDGQAANARSTTAQSTLSDLNTALQGQVGVDVNQEAANLIQEEQSYRAAAQVITTEQSTMDALLAAVG